MIVSNDDDDNDGRTDGRRMNAIALMASGPCWLTSRKGQTADMSNTLALGMIHRHLKIHEIYSQGSTSYQIIWIKYYQCNIKNTASKGTTSTCTVTGITKNELLIQFCRG